MDILTLIITLLSGGAIGSIVTIPITRKMKHAELQSALNAAKASDIQNQSSQIDLGQKYLEAVKDISTLLNENTSVAKETNHKLDSIVVRLDALEARQTVSEKQLASLIKYENGKYQDYLKDHEPVC